MAEHERTQTQGTTKPVTAAGDTAKGAQVMGAPLSPTGPNETEDGVIKAPPPEPPGEQPHLIGGDPGESIQSTPPYVETPEVKKAREDRKKAEADAKAKAAQEKDAQAKRAAEREAKEHEAKKVKA